ncbi:MAG: hypothetical protein GXY86_02245 [Firmicutes bacterium]|nr:hypothetical protein [Bacillota bacterium]
MKKLLLFVSAILVMLFSFSYSTSAKVIDIEVVKGVSVSLEKYLEPSTMTDPVLVTGSWGLNEHLLLKCAYLTEEERNMLGGRYSFNEKMAVLFEHQWKDSDHSNKYGFIYKFNLGDRWDLVGLAEYESKKITLTGQAEYQLFNGITAYAGFEYAKPDQGDAFTNLLVGAEYKPIDIFALYFDYLIPEEGDELIYVGVTYSF